MGTLNAVLNFIILFSVGKKTFLRIYMFIIMSGKKNIIIINYFV